MSVKGWSHWAGSRRVSGGLGLRLVQVDVHLPCCNASNSQMTATVVRSCGNTLCRCMLVNSTAAVPVYVLAGLVCIGECMHQGMWQQAVSTYGCAKLLMHLMHLEASQT
jgi:hypothetical protein